MLKSVLSVKMLWIQKNTPHPCGRAKFPHHEMSISPRGEICFVNLGQKWGHYYRKIIKFAF
jgi:hypothetical protein